MSKVIDALRLEHKSIENVLGVLEREIAALALFKRGRRADYTLAWSAVDYFTEFPDRVHHPKEDLVLARLRRADPAAALGVGDLDRSHAALSRELRDFSAALKEAMQHGGRPRTEFVEQARIFIDHQRLHMAMEEAYFFPVSDKTLDEQTWAGLEREMTARMDPLIGGESSERFEALRRHIESSEAARHRAPQP